MRKVATRSCQKVFDAYHSRTRASIAESRPENGAASFSGLAETGRTASAAHGVDVQSGGQMSGTVQFAPDFRLCAAVP